MTFLNPEKVLLKARWDQGVPAHTGPYTALTAELSLWAGRVRENVSSALQIVWRVTIRCLACEPAFPFFLDKWSLSFSPKSPWLTVYEHADSLRNNDEKSAPCACVCYVQQKAVNVVLKQLGCRLTRVPSSGFPSLPGGSRLSVLRQPQINWRSLWTLAWSWVSFQKLSYFSLSCRGGVNLFPPGFSWVQ